LDKRGRSDAETFIGLIVFVFIVVTLSSAGLFTSIFNAFSTSTFGGFGTLLAGGFILLIIATLFERIMNK